MITPSTAALAVSAARGLVKLGPRLDRLLAEKRAVQAALVLVHADVYRGPDSLQKIAALRAHLAQPAATPDPLGTAGRAELAAELAKPAPDNALVGTCFKRLFPERLQHAPFDPDAAYLAELKRLLPSFNLADSDQLAAAFAVTAGQDDREIGYAGRLALLVADTVAEFGAENSAFFVRDSGVREIVRAVLQRFAEPDLENFTRWSPLLHHTLGATLNGVLDARSALASDRTWLPALLDVLAAARTAPGGGDDFLLGLLHGRGYPLLISQGLARAATELAADQAGPFQQLGADLLRAAAPLAADSHSFRAFFADHWGDLLRAGLAGLERQGPTLLRAQPELLRNVLLGLVTELKEIPAAELLSNETLVRLGDAAISAAAANPALLTARLDGRPWLRALVESAVHTVARTGLRTTLSRAGLDALVTDAAGVLAEHPELLVRAPDAELLRRVVGGVLGAVAEIPAVDARALAQAAALGSLRTIAAHPALLETRYAELVADFSGRLAQLVAARSLTGVDAAALAEVAVAALVENPTLLTGAQTNLATTALDAVLRAAGGDPAKLLAGRGVVEVVRHVLGALARHGRAKIDGLAGTLADRLTAVVADALAAVSAELGHRASLADLPPAIGALVAAWARGDLAHIAPTDPNFAAVLARALPRSNA